MNSSRGGDGAAADSLYDKYVPRSARANRKPLDHGGTRSARLRASGVKLSVYLNTGALPCTV